MLYIRNCYDITRCKPVQLLKDAMFSNLIYSGQKYSFVFTLAQGVSSKLAYFAIRQCSKPCGCVKFYRAGVGRVVQKTHFMSSNGFLTVISSSSCSFFAVNGHQPLILLNLKSETTGTSQFSSSFDANIKEHLFAVFAPRGKRVKSSVRDPSRKSRNISSTSLVHAWLAVTKQQGAFN